MKILYSMKDLKKILFSIDVENKPSLLGKFVHAVDEPMEGYPKKVRMASYFEDFYRLTDGSYGQFMLSDEKDILVCSMGEIRLYGSKERPYFGNCIFVFAYKENHGEWMPSGNVPVEDLYPEHVAFRKDTVRRITALTKNYLRRFSSVIDSLDKTVKLVISIRDAQERAR